MAFIFHASGKVEEFKFLPLAINYPVGIWGYRNGMWYQNTQDALVIQYWAEYQNHVVPKELQAKVLLLT